MKKKTTDRYFNSLETEIDIWETGEGYNCSEIADMFGVLNKTNGGLNRRVIKRITETYKLDPSGYKYTEVYNTSNNSPYGYHSNEEPKFDGEELEFIERRLKACDVPDKDGYYRFGDISFRKDKKLRIFIKL